MAMATAVLDVVAVSDVPLARRAWLHRETSVAIEGLRGLDLSLAFRSACAMTVYVPPDITALKHVACREDIE